MELSYYELSILLHEATGIVDSTFETWLAATFAVVVVSYMASQKLNLKAKSFVAILYLATASFLFARYLNTMSSVMFYVNSMAELGASDNRRLVFSSVSLMRKAVFVFGTVGALAFLFFPDLLSKSKDDTRDA